MTRAADTAGLLTIDCGNSTLDCFRHDDGARLRLANGASGPDFREFVASRGIRRCVASTVVHGGLADAAVVLLDAGVPMQVAGIDLPCPLPLDYDTPATLGSDRWLGALAAHRRFGRAIVVDCGTATTVNLVELDGTFRGARSAPVSALVDGMRNATPALPAACLDEPTRLPPRSTQEAVDCGVQAGYAGLVQRLLSVMQRVARGPASVVITGGNGERLLRFASIRGTLVPDLVHDGLRVLAAGASCNS